MGMWGAGGGVAGGVGGGLAGGAGCVVLISGVPHGHRHRACPGPGEEVQTRGGGAVQKSWGPGRDCARAGAGILISLDRGGQCGPTGTGARRRSARRLKALPALGR